MPVRTFDETPVDRLGEGIRMLDAVADLVSSAQDLHLVDPDRLSTLLNVIALTFQDALDKLSAAPKA